MSTAAIRKCKAMWYFYQIKITIKSFQYSFKKNNNSNSPSVSGETPTSVNNNNLNSPSVSTAVATPTVSSKKKKNKTKRQILNKEKELLQCSIEKKRFIWKETIRRKRYLRRQLQKKKKAEFKTQRPLEIETVTSTTEMINKIRLNSEDFDDCAIIEESTEIIVIDDDDDDDQEQKKNIVTDVNQEESTSISDSLHSIAKSNIIKRSSKELETVNDNVNYTNSSHLTKNSNNEEHSKNTNNTILNFENKNKQEKTKENNNKQIVTSNSDERNNNMLLIEDDEEEFDAETSNQLHKNETILYETIASEESFNTEPTDNNNDTIIWLDDDSVIENDPSNSTDKDDSVLFVSESINVDKIQPSTSKALDYIPLEMSPSPQWNVPKRRKFDNVKNGTRNSPLIKRIGGDLFTASEHKEIVSYNSNTYNPNKELDKQPKTGKRMVLIDGSNVAFQHALNKRFSVKGLQICLKYFEEIGHDVKAIVPQFRLQQGKSTDPALLEMLHRNGNIVFTPCKNLPGKCSSSYDDRFLLQLACEFDAAIVSNDNYRDLINENPAFRKIIENRVIGYTWCNDMFILPKDPYGRLGPNLSIILNRN